MMSAVLAVDRRGTLGSGGRLPWHLPADLRRFREITLGHTVVMGRRTFEAIGRPLPGRRNVILTRNAAYRPAAAEALPLSAFSAEAGKAGGEAGTGRPAEAAPIALTTRPEEVRELASELGPEELFVIGGAEVFRLFLPDIRRFFVTRVDAEVAGDVRFPIEELTGLALVTCERRPADAQNAFALEFCVYERRAVAWRRLPAPGPRALP